jgi:hypothetical protein
MTAKQHEKLALRVLDSWPGTPEELGAVVYDATRTPYGVTEKLRRADMDVVSLARKRLLSCDGGRELYEAERKEVLGI